MVRNLAWLALAACGGIDAAVDASVDARDDDITEATAEVATTPTCIEVDANNCTNGPNILFCQSGNVYGGCIGEAGTNCEYFGDGSCEAQCAPYDYAASCGTPGPTSVLDPPTPTCRLVADNPGPTAQYCCPCE